MSLDESSNISFLRQGMQRSLVIVLGTNFLIVLINFISTCIWGRNKLNAVTASNWGIRLSSSSHSPSSYL
jgi:hypothetical protein